MSRRGVIRCALAAVLFGVSAPLAAGLAEDVHPFALAGLLYLGAAAAVLPLVARSSSGRVRLGAGAPRLVTAIAFGGAIGPVLLAAGLSRAPAATVSLLLNLELVFTVVLAAAVFGEHLGGRVVAGTMFVVAAGVALVWSGTAEVRWGGVLIAGACACWALDNCVTAGLDELTPAQITFAKGFVAGSANLAIGLLTGGEVSARVVFGALAIGAFGYGWSITLWVSGARDLGAARAQLVFATAPFIGASVAWIVFRDDVTSRQLAALAVAACGVAFVLRSDHEHAHAHSALEHDHEHSHADGHHDGHHDGHEVAGADSGVRHRHVHSHDTVVHAHPHVPDLHHRHSHRHSP